MSCTIALRSIGFFVTEFLSPTAPQRLRHHRSAPHRLCSCCERSLPAAWLSTGRVKTRKSVGPVVCAKLLRRRDSFLSAEASDAANGSDVSAFFCAQPLSRVPTRTSHFVASRPEKFQHNVWAVCCRIVIQAACKGKINLWDEHSPRCEMGGVASRLAEGAAQPNRCRGRFR